MADAQAQADMEQAPGGNVRFAARVLGQLAPPESRNDIIADKVVVLSFRNLQLSRIGALQDELLELSLAREPLPPNHADRVDQALRAYAQALRDYETLSVNAVPTIPVGARLAGSMRVAGEERGIRRHETFGRRVTKIALKILPGLEAYSSIRTLLPTITAMEILTESMASKRGSINLGPSSVVDMMERLCGDLGFRELDQQGRLRRAEKQALTQRLLMGLFGGIALICPVLVMVLYPSRNTNLITVSIATIVFAFLLAIGASDGTGKDVLAATAAYTAVLVVFFGTSASST